MKDDFLEPLEPDKNNSERQNGTGEPQIGEKIRTRPSLDANWTALWAEQSVL